MENLRDLQAQARSLERSGQHAAALELYDRILEEPVADRDGGVWVRAARLLLALGDGAGAARGFSTAADRYEAAGLRNLALSQCLSALRSDDSEPEVLLRFARLAASQRYARDARQAFVEYADRAVLAGDLTAASDALREYLGRFPADAALRRRFSELTGEEPPAPQADRPGSIDGSPAASVDAAVTPEGGADDEARVPGERLEGFEPTHVAEARDSAADAPAEATAELDHTRWGSEPAPAPGEEGAEGGEDLGLADQDGSELEEDQVVEEGEPLPLLGLEPTSIGPEAALEEEPLAEEPLAEEPLADEPADLRDGPAEATAEDELPLLGLEEAAPAPPPAAARASQDASGQALSPVAAATPPPRDYVDLGELILSGAPEDVTRFQVAIGEPSGNDESDFAEILDLFRKNVSASLDPKDAASHYDLGLAFKQMGLLDDAIVHLQCGLRGGANPLATLEVLGECFVLKGQTSLAARVFERATRLNGIGDSDLVGVLYGLACCQEDLGHLEAAEGTYERIIAVDLSFRDAAQRLQRLQSR